MLLHRDFRSGRTRNIMNIKEVIGVLKKMTLTACGKQENVDDGDEKNEKGAHVGVVSDRLHDELHEKA